MAKAQSNPDSWDTLAHPKKAKKSSIRRALVHELQNTEDKSSESFEVISEHSIGEQPVDIYLPTRRTVITCLDRDVKSPSLPIYESTPPRL